MATFTKISIARDPLYLDLPTCIHCGLSGLKDGHYQTILNAGRIGPFCSLPCQIAYMVAKKSAGTGFEASVTKSTVEKKTIKIPIRCQEAVNQALKKTQRNSKMVRFKRRTRALKKHSILDIDTD